MNDQSTPDEAPAHSIPRPDIDDDDVCYTCEAIALIEDEGDPHTCNGDYQESMTDTQVTQRLVDALEEFYADAGEEDREILKQTLNDLRRAYEAIRLDNDWAMDIN